MAIQLTAEEKVLRQGAKRASESRNESLMDTYSSQLDKRLTDRGALTETKGNPRERAKGLRPSAQMLEPTVSATELTDAPAPVQVPEPAQPSIPAGTLNVARNVSRNAQGFIEAQTAEAQRLRELQETFGGLQDQDSLSDVFQTQREQFGATPEALQELQDIQLRLADMDTASGLQKVEIESGGQSAVQGVRSLTQEDRENAVRSAGLAARAAVIQGNINTATQLAKDAVNIEYQQRTMDAQNLLQQINMVQGQVSEQDAQLLEQEKRQYEQELETISQVKDSVATALVSGATQQEIAELTSDAMPDEDKIALSQQIIARGANEFRDIELQQERASLEATQALAAQRSGSVTGVGTTINAATDLGLTGTEEDPMLSIIANSAGGRMLTQSEAEPLTNAKRVADGLADLQAVISQTDTDPILGLFQKVNPYNLNSVAIDTAINTLVPQLARGTYGEVGVLTDADMARYANTLPNLTSTEEQNKAVMALTLRKVRSGFASQIESMAAAGRDVSGYADIYNKFNQQIQDLESQIGIGTSGNDADLDAEFDEAFGDTSQSTQQTSNSPGFWKSVGNFFFGE